MDKSSRINFYEESGYEIQIDGHIQSCAFDDIAFKENEQLQPYLFHNVIKSDESRFESSLLAGII
jgi:hypothetical protein